MSLAVEWCDCLATYNLLASTFLFSPMPVPVFYAAVPPAKHPSPHYRHNLILLLFVRQVAHLLAVYGEVSVRTYLLSAQWQGVLCLRMGRHT